MKKIIITLVALLIPIVINASIDLEIDNLHYYLNTTKKTASVEKSSNTTGNVTIRATITYEDETYSVTLIRDYAFYNCRSLVSINIPNGVTSIGEKAFMDCVQLQTVSISQNSNLKNIGEKAFDGCSSLTSINIPDGVTSIGDYAFSGCSLLQTASISKSSQLVSIGNSAFRNCSLLQTASISNSSKLESIGSSAFSNCSSLTSINIPGGVTSIGVCAFSDCGQLQTASISKSSKLESIGSLAFYNCSSLASINIPDGVTSIGSSAFSNCSSLTSINIPDGVTSIESYTFKNCGQLQTVIISNSSKLESIGEEAFYDCNSLTSINIPDDVTSIGIEAFYNCSSLTSINIPDGVTSIGNYTFSGCSQLRTVSISQNSNLKIIGSYAFKNCSSLTSIKIPDGVTSIGRMAFDDCSQLQTASISKNSQLESIGEYAFSGCSSLTSFLIPAKVKEYASAFGGCSNISKLSFYCNYASNAFYSSRTKVENILIGNNVEIIGSSAFEDFTSLKTITFESGSSLKEIRDKAFYGCDALKVVILPETLETIRNYAFYGCSSLTSINIPNNVTSLGKDNYQYYGDCATFAGCSQLQTVSISNSSKLESIGSSTFSGCRSLTSINIPDGVTSIGNYAFSGCSQLQTVGISKSSQLVSIGNSAFRNCSSLTSFLIPAKVETVGNGAFYNCNNISKLSFYCKNVGSWFDNLKEKVESILIGKSVETIIGSSFKNFTSLSALTFEGSSSLKEIRGDAFCGCDALKEVDLPEPLETIGASAFSSCDALETIKLPNTLKVINNNAFNYCNAVKDVYAYMPRPFGIDASVFSTDTYNDAVLRVDGVADKYRKRFAWSKFFHIINIGETPGEGDGGINSGNSGSSGGQYTTQNYYYDLTAQGNGEIVVDEYITQMDLGMGASWTQYFEGLTVRDEQKVVEIPHFPGTGVPFKFIPDKGNILKQVLFSSENNGTLQDVTSDLVYDSSISGYTYQAVDHDSYPKLVAVFEEKGGHDQPDAIISYADANVKTICVNNWDADGDGELSKEEAAAVTSLGDVFMFNDEITSFDELQYFTGLTKLDDNEFTRCTSLTSLTIPASVTSIVGSALGGCSSLTTFKLADGNNSFTIDNGILYNKEKTILICCPAGKTGALTLPESVKEIGANGFYNCSQLTSVSLPSSVEKIGEGAFVGCSGLTSFNIPASLGRYYLGLEGGAFTGCTNLTAFTVDAANTNYQAVDGVLFELNNNVPTAIVAYPNKKGDKYTFPEMTATIREYAFCMTDIKELVFPNMLLHIGDNAFAYCSKLEKVTTKTQIPSHATFASAFANSTGTAKLYVPKGTKPLYLALEGWNCFGSNNIVESSGEGSPIFFVDDASGNFYQVLDDGESVALIWNQSPSSPTSFTIPSSVTYSGTTYTVTTVGSEENVTFDNLKMPIFGDRYSQLASLEIPNTVKKFRDYAFYRCPLTSLVIPNSVEEIGAWAFQCYDKMNSLTLGTGLKTIGKRAFSGCATQTLVIPEGVTSIGAEAFIYSMSLKTLTLPSTLNSIGSYAFGSCLSLETIYNYAKNPPVLVNTDNDANYKPWLAFASIDLDVCALWVPKGSNSKYMAAEGWKLFSNTQEMEGSDTEIITFADANVKAICVEKWDTDGDGELSMDEAAAVTSLGTVFKNNDQITSFDELQYFTGLATIEESAFADCDNLTSISIPSNVTSIGDRAFFDCTGLKYVVSYIKEPCDIDYDVFRKIEYTPLSGGTWEEECVSSSATLYVPIGSLEKYKAIYGWTRFARKVEMKLGDANGDRNVDKNDVTTIADYIIGKNVDNCYELNADLKDDKVVNVADIVKLVDIIKKNSMEPDPESEAPEPDIDDCPDCEVDDF